MQAENLRDKVYFCSSTPILCVNDMEKSLAYYRDVLGFTINWAWSEEQAFEGGAPTFACVCRDDIAIFLCLQGQGQPGAWMSLHLNAPAAVDAVYAEYQERGAIIAETPNDKSWGMREMQVQDPDGNTFRIGAVLETPES